MPDLDPVEKAKQYATNKYHSVRDDMRRQADADFAEVRAKLGRAGMAFSSSTDRAVGDNRSALIRALVQKRVDALIDGFEINGVTMTDTLEQFIVAEAEQAHSIAIKDGGEASALFSQGRRVPHCYAPGTRRQRNGPPDGWARRAGMAGGGFWQLYLAWRSGTACTLEPPSMTTREAVIPNPAPTFLSGMGVRDLL